MSGTPAETVLGVEQSVSGQRWRARASDDRAAFGIAQRLGVPEIIGRILAGRGVDPEDAEAWLDPTIRDLMPDPLGLSDMAAATDRLVRAIAAGEGIAIFGDYDVDGATSAALLERFLLAAGTSARIYVPDRIKEGYGPSPEAMKRLAAEGARVVVTVDCGIAAFAALEAARDAGLDVVVVDHHMAGPSLPPAVAVVNPNRLDDDSGLGALAAVGVTFMLVVALNRRLREAGFWDGRIEPDLLGWLDLVALGTVCDMVPLTGLNRALVTRGLAVMARRGNPGLAALADVAGVNEPPRAWHLGFLMGPRVNAGGRVGEAGQGARLLVTGDADEAARIAGRLDVWNSERREIEQAVFDQAAARAETLSGAGGRGIPGPFLLVAGEGWHLGVLGIVASRLVRRHGVPVCVIGIEGETARGSGRSVRGVDLGAAIIAARQAGLLEAGGGHPMAAGLTARTVRLDELREFLTARIAASGPGDGAGLGVDGVLTVAAATRELLGLIDRAGPWGSGNAEPRFALADARIAHARTVGGDGSHVSLKLEDAAGGRLKAIAFRAFETGIGEALMAHAGRTMHLAGHLRPDSWQGREGVQLFVEDAAEPLG